ncbi:MAG: hypothetical protein JXA69_21325 [Phycisphaerae bacterium]|nr:hypothetical protein [Phycisphaerae bacterium]
MAGRAIGRAILVFLIIGPIATLAADVDAERTWLIERFDGQITAQVEAAVARPPKTVTGRMAWKEAYTLAALAEMLEATRDVRYAELFVKLADWAAAARDDRQNRRDVVRGRIMPAWGSAHYSQGEHYVFAVHTGVIAAPMARFAGTVRRDPVLSKRYAEAAERFLRIAEEAVAVHADQYTDGPGENEGYLNNRRTGKLLPLNQQNALGCAWLFIDDATGKPQHRERIRRLAWFLKNRLRKADDGAYLWAYWPPLDGVGQGFEDISHAAINVDFIVLCAERDIVFTGEDLVRLEKTLLAHVIRPDGSVANTVGGTGDPKNLAGQVLRWGRLATYCRGARERLLEMAHTLPLEKVHSSPLGLAHLVAACNRPATTAPTSQPARPARLP